MKFNVLAATVAAILVSNPVLASDDDNHSSTPVVTNPVSNVNGNRNRNTNTNNNRNTNRNSNTNRNVQGQNQAQTQAQNQAQSQTQAATATASGNGSGNVTSVNQYSRDRLNVASAYAGSLTSGFDTCQGSITGGVQTQILGLTGGKTTVDQNCVLIKQVQLLTQMGYHTAACYRARQGEEGAAIDAAMKSAGVECEPAKQTVVVTVVAPPVQQLYK